MTRLTQHSLLIFACGLLATGCVAARAQSDVPAQALSLTAFGHLWTLRGGDLLEGAGPNYWSNSQDAVSVDDRGRLRLAITNSSKGWRGAEAFTELPGGPVRIRIEVDSPVADFPPNVVAGLFVYKNDQSEMDIELARWGEPNAPNAQFVVVPAWREGNRRRFHVADRQNTGPSVFVIEWRTGRAHFEATVGGKTTAWTYEGTDVPEPFGHRLHLNLWMMPKGDRSWSRGPELVVRSVSIDALPVSRAER